MRLCSPFSSFSVESELSDKVVRTSFVARVDRLGPGILDWPSSTLLWRFLMLVAG